MELAINAYRKSLADRKVQNMIHLREKAEGMTAAEISVTREEGFAEGRVEGKAEVAQALLQRGMDREEVKAITGLADKELPIV
ncbi:MAG: hypothetical protein AB9903_22325 [Vulcanimicrobiota bacterium]